MKVKLGVPATTVLMAVLAEMLRRVDW